MLHPSVFTKLKKLSLDKARIHLTNTSNFSFLFKAIIYNNLRFCDMNNSNSNFSKYNVPTKSSDNNGLCNCMSQKKFYKSADEKTDTTHSKTTSGTSVCFQFWHSNSFINLNAMCSKSASNSFWKRLNLETIRKYDQQNDDFSSREDGKNVKLKVMNYNVLSQGLLTAHQYLYRLQKSFMLNWDNRKSLILDEIIKVNPDIICLQEVEESELLYFYKHLESYGYKRITKMKTRHRGDGLAIYYRSADIQLIEADSVEFRQPGILELENRDNVAIIAKLQKGGKKFIIANTHLLYNPKRTEVRLAQVQMLLAELQRIARKDEEDQAILLMGDFNSSPESPVINFILDGKLLSQYRPLPLCLGISAQCMHLQDGSKLYHSEKQPIAPAEGQAESIAPPSFNEAATQSFLISHSFNFSSVYNISSQDDQRGATTFQTDWIMVDFIFYTKGFELLSRLGLPTPSACKKYVKYLPNDINPSDHLPLIAEFEIL